MKLQTPYTVECNVCKQRYENWVGSTPCCGSIAYLLSPDGEKTESFMVYTLKQDTDIG